MNRSISIALITWTKEKYGTNIDTCDDEHKVLFTELNKLHELVTNDADRMAVGIQLDSFISYTAEHFASEEQHLMRLKNYYKFDEHKAEHDELLAICSALQTKFHKGEVEVTAYTSAFVKSWLADHIPKYDIHFDPLIKTDKLASLLYKF